MAKRESRGEYKRRVLIEEVAHRVALMRDSQVDTEFAAIENGYEVRFPFVPEPCVSNAGQPAPQAESRRGRITKSKKSQQS